MKKWKYIAIKKITQEEEELHQQQPQPKYWQDVFASMECKRMHTEKDLKLQVQLPIN